MTVENPKEAVGRTKLPLQLIPPAGSKEMALGLAWGAYQAGPDGTGYGAWNWRKAGINYMTYIGAMKRHLDAILDGEDLAPDSQVSHIGHILAGAAIVADAEAHGMLNDDRPGKQLGD